MKEVKYKLSVDIIFLVRRILENHNTSVIYLLSPVGKSFSFSPAFLDNRGRVFSPLSLSISNLKKIYQNLVQGDFYYYRTFDNFKLKIKPKK